MTTLFTESDIGLMAEQYQGEKLDYGLDWSSALIKTPGDAIAVSTWTPAEAGLTFTNAAFLAAWAASESKAVVCGGLVLLFNLSAST